MKCLKCGIVAPFPNAPSDHRCMGCGAELAPETDDFLLHGRNGLVREVRPGQVKMGRLTETVLNNRDFALIEGPVGIGKSFAYTIPAILSGKRIVISTAKKQLQHQLAQKDLPFLGDRLEKAITVAMLKGKSNYACAMKAQSLPPEHAQPFNAWLKQSKSQDLSDWPGKKPFYWADVTAEDCVGGRRCRFADQCGYWSSKKQLKTAQIVVANHHVVAWDLKFGPKKILGPYDALIIDEAHQAVSAFRGAYTQQVGPYLLKRLTRLDDQCGLDSSKYLKPLGDVWDAMFKKLAKLDGEIPANPFEDMGLEALTLLGKLRNAIKQEMTDNGGGVSEDEGTEPDDDPEISARSQQDLEYLARLEMYEKAVKRPMDALSAIEEPGDNTVVYITTTEKQTKYVNAAPVDIGPMVGPKLQMLDTVIVTSATMSIAGSFRDIRSQLGLSLSVREHDEDGEETGREKKVEELVLETPFDYSRQALLYTPYNMPQPVSGSSNPDYPPSQERVAYIEALARECANLIRASDGNAFVLFTATSDMRDVRNALLDHDLTNPLLMQEDDAESTFKQFMATPRSVVLGLKSFWEGVDVQGDKLRLVVITKLPFPQVKDPVIQARSRAVKRAALARGMNEATAETTVFKDVSIPLMLTDLRQGAGRLIRSRTDKGVLAILDPRIWTGSGKKLPIVGQRTYNGYGGQAASAIGFSNKTGDFALTSKFLQRLRDEEAARAAKAST
jgi:ATP-dependent DNA helicase DinG